MGQSSGCKQPERCGHLSHSPGCATLQSVPAGCHSSFRSPTRSASALSTEPACAKYPSALTKHPHICPEPVLAKRSLWYVKVGEDVRFHTCRLRDVNHLRALRRTPTRCSRCKVGISTNTRGPNETRIFQAVCNNYCGASVPDSRAMHCICMHDTSMFVNC